MASPFWKYFHEKLGWGLIHAPGPVSAILKGLALRLDVVREDAVFTREQWYPQLCEPGMVPHHGASRGLTRYYKETPEQFRQRVINAYAWHMLGGKQKGLPEILRFYGFDALHIENMAHEHPERWAEFMVQLRDPKNVSEQKTLIDDLDKLVWLINEYKPARSKLFRLYTSYFDRRPIKPTKGPAISEGYLSYYSGVEVPGIPGPIVSFGMRHAVQNQFPVNPQLRAGVTLTLGVTTRFLDRFIVGISRIGDVYPRRYGSSFSELTSFHNCLPVIGTWPWQGEWDNRPWFVVTDWTLPRPTWNTRPRLISRNQCCIGERGKLIGDTNCRIGVTKQVVIKNPQRLSQFTLSASCMRTTEVIHEMLAHTVSAQTGPLAPKAAPPVFIEKANVGSGPLHDLAWKGEWDRRHWFGYVSPASVFRSGTGNGVTENVVSETRSPHSDGLPARPSDLSGGTRRIFKETEE